MPDLYPLNNPRAMSAKSRVTDSAISAYSRRLPGSVTDYPNFIQRVTGVIVPNPNLHEVEHTATVSQTIAFSIIKPIRSNVTVTQTVAPLVDRRKIITDVLPITQIVIAYLDKNVSGNTGNVFVDPAVKAFYDSLVPPALVTFSCSDPNTSISLRKPEFGDNDAYEQFRIQRLTLGGDLQIQQDSMWPSTEVLDFTFHYMSEESAADLVTFLGATVGKVITFDDQFGRTLDGFIVTPFNEILQPKKNGWSASFSFQLDTPPNETSP